MQSIEKLYDNYYDSSQFEIPTAPVVATSLERLVQSCEAYRKTGRWIDVGYGQGALLKFAESHGWDCHGTELSPQAIDYGTRRGWIVGPGGEDDSRFPAGGFDVVTMLECLEHVADPDLALRSTIRWLRPGGLLYLTTPNAQSLNSRLLGPSWSIFWPPEHLTIWSARGVKRALQRSGFEHMRVRTPGFNPHDLRSRIAAGCGHVFPSDRNAMALGLNNALSRGLLRRGIKAGINSCLTALHAGDSLKVWAVRGVDPAAR